MGTEIAQTHATLTLAYFEENLYEIIGKRIWQRHKKTYQIMGKIFG